MTKYTGTCTGSKMRGWQNEMVQQNDPMSEYIGKPRITEEWQNQMVAE